MIMAKLLTIGAEYSPNFKLGVDQDGNAVMKPCVLFFFNCDDRTANLVKGSGEVRNVYVKNGSLVKPVPVDGYQKFIHGAKLFPSILAAIKKYGGYEYDTSNLDALEAQVEKVIDDVTKSEMSSRLQVDRGAYIDDILEALEKNINDPNFMAYLNAIGAIRKFDDNDFEKVVSFSALNNAMILTQWLKSGHSGAPRFLATKVQWLNFNREPATNATPMYAMAPSGTEHGSKQNAMQMFGIDSQTYKNNPMARHLVKKGMYDKNFGDANNNVGGGYMLKGPYYDISETVLIQGAQENYDFSNASSISSNINTATTTGDDATRFDSVRAKDETHNKYDVKTLLSNVETFANKQSIPELESMARSGNIGKVVDYLVENSDTISRLRGKGYSGYNTKLKNEKEKRDLYAALTKALIYLRFGLDSSVAQKIIGENMRHLRNKAGGFNKNAFNVIMSDFQNVYFIMAGINESAEDNLFIWGLNALGVSVGEYKNMPDTEEQAIAELEGIKESFKRELKKLI